MTPSVRAPRLDFEALPACRAPGDGELFDPLETDRGIRRESQRLHVVRFHLRQVVAGDVQMQRAAQRDVEHLGAFAHRQDRHAPLERLWTAANSNASRSASASSSIRPSSVRRRLAQVRGANIRAPREQQAVHGIEIGRAGARVGQGEAGMRREERREQSVLPANPGNDRWHEELYGARPHSKRKMASPPRAECRRRVNRG